MKPAVLCVVLIALGSISVVAAPFSYDDYAAVLEAHVDDAGRVDYAALKAKPVRLDAFVASLARLSPDTYDAWDDTGKIAFWINAYNGLTLKLIVDRYPIQPPEPADPAVPANSIRNIPGAWDAVTFVVMGEDVTLDHIEHGILRSRFDEPRIHMALVCAAVSCPPLRREPYREDDLDAQLDYQTSGFLARPSGMAVDRDAGVARLSAIFDWFKDDFVKQYKGGDRFDRATAAVLDFVGRYVGDEDRRYLKSGEFEVEYFDYDWTLNE